MISSGGCTEISVTSEKVSKDDPEENVCSFFVSTGDGGRAVGDQAVRAASISPSIEGAK